MKKKVKPILLSLFIFVVIILISHFISKSIGNYDEDDFKKAYISSFIILYLPVLFSICLFNKNKNWLYLKSPILSFLTIYLLVFIYFKYLGFRKNYNFFDISTLMNSFLAFFTALFVNFILVISLKINKKKKNKAEEIKYSLKNILLIPLLLSLIYSLLIIIGSSSFVNVLHVLTGFLPIGIVLSIISINFFIKVNNIYKILSYYILTTLVCVMFSNIPFIINSSHFSFDQRFFRNLVLSVVLFGVFYLFIIALVHLYYLKLVSKAEKQHLTQQSLESQLNYQQLKNQISPHFLFNNINVLTSLIEENPKKAVSFSENLSNIYRCFLEQEKQDVVLLKDEIAFAKSYLALLKDRFEVGLNFTINIDEKAKEKYIVATILQQVLENVVKHNTINEDNLVTIEISSKENYLIVENNKNVKLKTANTSKKGIENIKKRIAFFTDEKVIIKNKPEVYIIYLPILETV